MSGIQTNIEAISEYARQLPFYEGEADKFRDLIDTADVTDEAWGIMGVFAKQGYTDRLEELRSLLEELKNGVDGFITKLNKAAEMYQGAEDVGTITFGQHQAQIDAAGGPNS
ncbi:hypothetical protein SAXI111661_16460 [Saccharomonospora xinjiangensis]|uniref:Excreted virulence factor EspC, type VII ESX diderm n=1 Tax=Saccharomonospora xinjiangensis XJ-54 TaxID=882086 RepID=I0V3G8_9PSEU|nr:hypothetical protein [Saccharomonospora xinjiangensis]EID54671.1 hypothetical protein SacxiDRAFT_2447 [Saccharomonospora xinjiangensis XJ-54]QBQ62369.1 hypothetical protein EYD13_20165 [Saccharomonospora xinjiangensis]